MASRASDYTLPNFDGFNAGGAKATDWLADAEIKISYAVLDYARDARGGRIDPQRLSENLDPTLALPDPFEVIQSIAGRTDPAMYLRSFQPDQPQFEAPRRKLIEMRSADGGSKKTGANNSKIRAILVNMERWRWLPNDLGPYYVNVNVPEFMLRVVDDGKVIHTARCRGGQTRQTDADLLQGNAGDRFQSGLECPQLDQNGGSFAMADLGRRLVRRKHCNSRTTQPARQIWRPRD